MDPVEHTVEDGPPAEAGTTYRYVDMVEIGAWFGIGHRAVANWRTRYADTHPFPEPDVIIGRTPGWSRDRKGEIELWAAGRAGPGAGGGRPRKER
ncbi:hypothetical protein DMA12_19635 [Amycolatopsis balhimycina DSM 5908]|uniref:Uncharacterized protein n=1 Tax=Amycolatopsis balhimycina DSM 5908 TaxID=1081091 RepID=A0A428WJG6_AMYBA|nr:hypothetical protein [Amycolatopsis balhimycina]RSM43160.1 hypothetical protein DMA12_19635 [Amycolatopsis balhimycina DSM 5908]